MLIPHACHTIRIGVSDLIQHIIADGHSVRDTHSGGPHASLGDGVTESRFLLSSSERLYALITSRAVEYSVALSANTEPSAAIVLESESSHCGIKCVSPRYAISYAPV